MEFSETDQQALAGAISSNMGLLEGNKIKDEYTDEVKGLIVKFYDLIIESDIRLNLRLAHADSPIWKELFSHETLG